MQDMEQHHKAARNDRMGHPEQGRNEAEQKINGFGDGATEAVTASGIIAAAVRARFSLRAVKMKAAAMPR